jgi:hypothetical protein
MAEILAQRKSRRADSNEVEPQTNAGTRQSARKSGHFTHSEIIYNFGI